MQSMRPALIARCAASSNGASSAASLWCWRQSACLFGVFVLSIFGFGHVQQQFFPLSERPELFFQLRLPAGTAFGATLDSVKRAERLLKGDEDISTYTAYVGQGSPRFWLGL